MSDKVQSRKFMVWLVWLIIAVLMLIAIGIAIVITKKTPDNLVGLFGTTLQNFFYISAIYLGVNVLQKGAFAISDAIAGKKEEECENAEDSDLR